MLDQETVLSIHWNHSSSGWIIVSKWIVVGFCTLLNCQHCRTPKFIEAPGGFIAEGSDAEKTSESRHGSTVHCWTHDSFAKKFLEA
jgi:hypothetical protein